LLGALLFVRRDLRCDLFADLHGGLLRFGPLNVLRRVRMLFDRRANSVHHVGTVIGCFGHRLAI
jgi:hypothetical protein